MPTELTALAVTFGTILLVELPDKTLLATLVLATRYRPWPVWLGVGAAFGVQVTIAVAAGQLATLLPRTVVTAAAAVIFALGAVLLLREARGARAQGAGAADEEEAVPGARLRATTSAWGIAGTSFLVLFTAEWGDLSQLLTASLAARYDAPVAVFAGAWAALLVVSGLAVLLGRVLLARVRLSLLYAVGAGVCLLLAAVTAVSLLGS